MKFDDLTGRRFGSLTVLKFDHMANNWVSCWLCKCDCGNTKVVRRNYLFQSKIPSCGCKFKEKNGAKMRQTMTTHGSSYTRLYRIWRGMKARCDNANNKFYRYYGGKGIYVCENWHDDFTAFEKWAIANGYDDTLTIDRIDGEGNYEPSNCRWSSRSKQMRNISRNRYLTYKGQTKCIADWAGTNGLSGDVIRARAGYKGWTTEEIFETPIATRRGSYWQDQNKNKNKHKNKSPSVGETTSTSRGLLQEKRL